MTSPSRSLAAIEDDLEALENQVAALLGPPDATPRDVHHDARTAALNLMRAIHDADPGVWVPLRELGSYHADRAHFRALQDALAWLVDAGHVQRISVSVPGKQGRRPLLRLSTDVDQVDVAAVAARLNAELAPIGHSIEVNPARPTFSHFRPRTVTLVDGTTYQCYHRWHLWEPRLVRIAPE